MNFTALHKKKNELRGKSFRNDAVAVSQRASTINRQMVFREFRKACNSTYMSKRTMVCSHACAIEARTTILSPSLRMHKAAAPTEISQLR